MRLTILALSLLAVACGGPSDQELARVVHDHLRSVAPDGLPSGGWDDVVVEPTARESGADGAALLAFQVFDPDTVAARGDSLRGPVHVATLQESGGGWTVTAYGEGLARAVAVLVAKDRRQRYAALMDTFPHFQLDIRGATSDWARAPRREFASNPAPARMEELRTILEGGVPADTLLEGLHQRGWGTDGVFEIGVVDEDPADGAEAVWIRRADDDTTVCGRGLRRASPPSLPWLVDHYPTCRGPRGIYVEEYPPETILAEIQARGVAAPAEPAGS